MQADDNQYSAALRVFMVPELLEQILLRCTLTDLLINIPRVCTHFKATIENSIKLQRPLFFQPVTDTVLYEMAFSHAPGYYTKPSDTKLCEPWPHPVVENPFLLELSNDFLIQFGDDLRKREVIERPEASWRRMLVTQPPLQFVRLHTQWCGCVICGRQCPNLTASAADAQGAKMEKAISEELTPLYRQFWLETNGASTAEAMGSDFSYAMSHTDATIDPHVG